MLKGEKNEFMYAFYSHVTHPLRCRSAEVEGRGKHNSDSMENIGNIVSQHMTYWFSMFHAQFNSQ